MSGQGRTSRYHELESRKDEIIQAWEGNGKNCNRTAQVLGIPESTLRDKLKQWNLLLVAEKKNASPTPPHTPASHPEETSGLEKETLCLEEETTQETPVSQENPTPPPHESQFVDQPVSDKDIALAQISALLNDKSNRLQDVKQEVLHLEEEMLSLQEDIGALERTVILIQVDLGK